MVGLVDRFSKGNLLKYFHGDFDPSIWGIFPAGLGEVCSPKALLPGGNSWRSLSFDTFVSLIPQQSGNVLAYEFGFGPPKSFSIAALFGLPNSEDLLRMHDQAVGDAVCFITQSLVPRVSVSRPRFGRLFDRPIFRFKHFANRVNEPQLHEHVVVIARGEGGSVDGTVLYNIQSSMDCVYLHTLSVLLRRAGYGLVEKGRRWEIEGIDPEVVRRYSSRSVAVEDEWNPARKRNLLLRGRKQLGPKASWKDFEALLKTWSDLGRTLGVIPPPPALSIPELEEKESPIDDLFRLNSTQTFFELVVSQIRSGCVVHKTAGELLEKLNEKLMAAKDIGKIAISFDGGSKFCHTEVFQKEEAVLQRFRDGLGHATPIPLPDCPPHLAVLQRALSTSNQFRIVELNVEKARAAYRLLGNDFPSRFSIVADFSAESILEALGPPSSYGHLILVMKPSKPLVGSSFRSALLTMVCGKRRDPRLQRGRVPISVVGFGSRPYEEAWRGLTGGSGPGVIVGMGEPEVLEPVFKGFQQLASTKKGCLVPIDVEQPWTTVTERCALLGSWLIGLKQSKVVRHGTRWRVTAVSGSQVDVVSPSGHPKAISWSLIESVRDMIAFIREQYVAWPKGTSARVVRGLGRRGQKSSKAGEWHLLQHVYNDGTLELESGVGMFPGFRVLAPRYFISEEVVSGVERLIVWHEQGSAEEILRHRPTRRMIIFTQFPKILSKELGKELVRQRELKGKRHGRGICKPSPRDYWRQFLGFARGGPSQGSREVPQVGLSPAAELRLGGSAAVPESLPLELGD